MGGKVRKDEKIKGRRKLTAWKKATEPALVLKGNDSCGYKTTRTV